MNPDTALTSPQLIVDQDGAPGSTVADLSGFRGLVGDSPAMLELYARVLGLVDRATVVVEGETGTGKELVARVLHGLADQPHRPLLHLSGTHMERTAYRSELERLSPAATGGTLILDEVTELPAAHQRDLLEFLEDIALPALRRRREGRFVALVQQDLASAVAAGTFLEPLARHLAGADLAEGRVVVPALRHRREDLPLLVHYFLKVLGEHYGRVPVRLSEGVWSVFFDHPWSGNVRELRNEIERLVVLAPPGGVVDLRHLSPEMLVEAGLVTTDDTLEASGRMPDTRLRGAIGHDASGLEAAEHVVVVQAAAGLAGAESEGCLDMVSPEGRGRRHPGYDPRSQWRDRSPALRPSLAPVEVMRIRHRRRRG